MFVADDCIFLVFSHELFRDALHIIIQRVKIRTLRLCDFRPVRLLDKALQAV